MRTIVDGFREMVHLIGDTFRLWWRNLLPMATWFLAGYVGFKVCLQSAIWLDEHSHSSVGVGVFSAGVLMQIAAYVGMIRTCATSLYRWRDAATNKAEETSDPTQQGLMELLAVTLLPLVAVWSAWGFLENQLQQLTVSNIVQRGMQSGATFFELSGGAWHKYLPVIVILLVLRRVIQAIDDRRPSRPAKFVQVWAEAFFLLITVVVTPFVIADAKNWVKRRVFWDWTVDRWDGLKDFFEGINVPIPAGLEFLWGFFWESLWPLFKLGVAEPLTWLAITTVVFGHRVLSGGGVFRGTRLERRLGGSDVAEAPKQNRIVALDQPGAEPGARWAAGEVLPDAQRVPPARAGRPGVPRRCLHGLHVLAVGFRLGLRRHPAAHRYSRPALGPDEPRDRGADQERLLRDAADRPAGSRVRPVHFRQRRAPGRGRGGRSRGDADADKEAASASA